MKKLLSIIVVTILGTAVITSCKKGGLLDESTTTTLNETTTFTDSINTLAFLTRIYQNAGYLFDIQYHAAGGHSVAADEGVSGRYNGTQNSAVAIAFGLVSPNTTIAEFLNMWRTPYQNIRRVNLLLRDINMAPLTAETKKGIIAEARFLRAWYYFLLVRTFGGVPMVGDKVYDITDNISISRSTFEECVNYGHL